MKNKARLRAQIINDHVTGLLYFPNFENYLKGKT